MFFQRKFNLKKLKGGLIVILFITLLLSCSKGKEAQDRILTPKEMTLFMVEMYLKEARISNLNLPEDSSRQMMQYFKDNFASSEGLGDSVLFHSMNYYLSRPNEMEQILDAVIDSLSLREQKAVNFQ